MASNSSRQDSASDSAQQPTHGSPRMRRKRQLDLVKCHRCRVDKQKCLPTRRVWPSKCNRCSAKGLPCSEGNRVERNSKHNSKLPIPLSDEPADSSQMQNLEDHLNQVHVLFVYHKNLTSAMSRLRALKEKTVAPFFNIRHTSMNFEKSGEFLLESFYEQLESTMFKIANDLLTIHPAIPPLPTTLLHGLSAKVLTAESLTKTCPICDSSSQRRHVDVLLHKLDVGDEFLARQYRLSKHFDVENHGLHQEVDHHLLDHELFCYKLLSTFFAGLAQRVFEKLKMREAAAMCRQIELYHPDTIGAHRFERGEEQQDCFARTSLHCWLDAMTHAPDQVDLELLQPISLRTATRIAVNTQDILGRSPLHIACQKGWVEGVDALLKLGANSQVTTIYGSLPLHYAAANGSTKICKMLIEKMAIHARTARDCQGKTALEYAVDKNHTEAIQVLPLLDISS